MTEEPKTLEDVSSELRVTDRGLNEYMKLAHFATSDIPQNAKVLNLGSGLSQRFEREIRKVRPDISIVSIDPSLFQEHVVVDRQGFKYRFDEQEAHQRREELANKENSIVAIGQKLPFSNNTIDFAIDVHGPAQYAKTEEVYKSYLREVMRVLKPGGKFHISHVYFGDPLAGDIKSLRDTEGNAKRIFRELGLKAEVFHQNVGFVTRFIDKELKSFDDIRVGAILTKA